MEERGEFDSKQVTNKPPSLVNVPSITPQPINNPLPVKVEHVQQVRNALGYVFLETSTTYAQHESLKNINLLFEQTSLLKHKPSHRL
jgi:hypothetical protein